MSVTVHTVPFIGYVPVGVATQCGETEMSPIVASQRSGSPAWYSIGCPTDRLKHWLAAAKSRIGRRLPEGEDPRHRGGGPRNAGPQHHESLHLGVLERAAV